MGTFTAGAKVAIGDGRLYVRRRQRAPALRRRRAATHFQRGTPAAGAAGALHHRTGVFRLTDDGLVLTEIAPGVDLDRDVLAHMDFHPAIAPDLRLMDAAIFTDAPLGLAGRSPPGAR